jgi:hypothetical protein
MDLASWIFARKLFLELDNRKQKPVEVLGHEIIVG